MMKKLSTILILRAVALPVLVQRASTIGWSSWNTFAIDINEQLICQQADTMHSSGVQDAGYCPNNDMQWQHVYIANDCSKTMTIHSFSGDWREFNVEVNGKQVGTYPVEGKDWTTKQSIKVEVDLRQGKNVFRLRNDGVFLPDIDMMELNSLPNHVTISIMD